jgi:hypothetical protein
MSKRATVRFIVLVGAITFAGLPSLNGCESTGSMSSQAMSLLPESVKSSVSSYTQGLSGLNNALASITSNQQALRAIPGLQSYVDQINSASQYLSSLSPDTKSTVKKAAGDQMSSLTKDFDKQVSRIKDNSSLKSTLGPVLDQLQLFRL